MEIPRFEMKFPWWPEWMRKNDSQFLGLFFCQIINALMTAHSKIYTTAGNRRRLQKSTESHRKPQETRENQRKPRKQYKSLENKRQAETAENQRKPENQR